MSYQQIADIIDQLCASLDQIEESIEATLQGNSDSHSCSILVSILAEQQRIRTGLGAYRREGDPGVLQSWMQFVPNEQLKHLAHDIEFSSDMPADEIAARKMTFDKELIEFYEHLSNYANNDRVVNFFSELRLEAETRAANQCWLVREFQPDGNPPATNDQPHSSDHST